MDVFHYYLTDGILLNKFNRLNKQKVQELNAYGGWIKLGKIYPVQAEWKLSKPKIISDGKNKENAPKSAIRLPLML